MPLQIVTNAIQYFDNGQKKAINAVKGAMEKPSQWDSFTDEEKAIGRQKLGAASQEDLDKLNVLTREKIVDALGYTPANQEILQLPLMNGQLMRFEGFQMIPIDYDWVFTNISYMGRYRKTVIVDMETYIMFDFDYAEGMGSVTGTPMMFTNRTVVDGKLVTKRLQLTKTGIERLPDVVSADNTTINAIDERVMVLENDMASKNKWTLIAEANEKSVQFDASEYKEIFVIFKATTTAEYHSIRLASATFAQTYSKNGVVRGHIHIAVNNGLMYAVSISAQIQNGNYAIVPNNNTPVSQADTILYPTASFGMGSSSITESNIKVFAR